MIQQELHQFNQGQTLAQELKSKDTAASERSHTM